MPLLRCPKTLRRRIAPSSYGALEALGGVLGLCGACFVLTLFIPVPSVRLFQSVAQIGATLLIAFAVELTWLVKASEIHSRRRETWIGFVSCLGLVGLSGIAASLAVVEHLAAGHENWLDRLAFAWVLSSFVVLGAVVALQPATVYAWRRAGSLESDARST